MAAVTKWLHVEYVKGDPWILPVWSALNDSAKSGLLPPLTDELGQLGLHISTRLAMARVVVGRLESTCSELARLIGSREPHHEFTAPRDGYVFRLPADFSFGLLADIDALLFELNSCCELMGQLFEKLYAHAGQAIPRKPVGLSIRAILESAGQNTAWFRQLDELRNFFTHHAAPYFAVDLSADDGQRDLLVMKRNLESFDDEMAFVRYSTLLEIFRRFWESKPIIQQHLVELVRKRNRVP